MNADSVVAALAKLHPAAEWSFLTEVSGAGQDQRIDAYAVSLWRSRGFVRHAYEVKVSRGDLRRELAKPGKRLFAMGVSNQYWIAAPRGLVRPDELPEECGLVEVDASGVASVAVKARWRDTPEPDLGFMVGLPRRAYQLGLRAAAETSSIPGWPLVERLMRAASLAGRAGPFGRWSETEGCLRNLSQALRAEGRHVEARSVDAMRREGAAREKERKAEEFARLAERVRALPRPRGTHPETPSADPDREG